MQQDLATALIEEGARLNDGELARWLARTLAAAPNGLFPLLVRSPASVQVKVMRAANVLAESLPLPVVTKVFCEILRTNSRETFAGIALDNSFAASALGERAFNQLVLKCLFLELDPQRIVNLRMRLSEDLVDAVKDFVQERTSARRPLPAGALWILNIHQPELV